MIEQRAAQRYEKEQEEYEQKMKERRDKGEKTGKKPRGKAPNAPTNQPGEKDQYNFTDPGSRIMKTSRGFDQCFNAQAAVNDDMLIVGAYSNSHVNDKQEFIPAIEAVVEEFRGELTVAVADTGYFSEKNITDCEEKKITPLISTSRESHNSFLSHLLTAQIDEEPGESAVEKMNRQLKSEKGKEIYKKRKQTVEPVFGIIKEILGFRRFSLRGEAETDAEWSLVCSAYNLKRLFNLQMA